MYTLDVIFASSVRLTAHRLSRESKSKTHPSRWVFLLGRTMKRSLLIAALLAIQLAAIQQQKNEGTGIADQKPGL